VSLCRGLDFFCKFSEQDALEIVKFEQVLDIAHGRWAALEVFLHFLVTGAGAIEAATCLFVFFRRLLFLFLLFSHFSPLFY